jgi:transposase-like protein
VSRSAIAANHNPKASFMSHLENEIFQNVEKAREFLEAVRWPDGPVCPHCGELEKLHRLEGKASRPGLWQCNSCLLQFSVTVGTVFERSKIPLNQWMQATFLLCGSKKGISAHQMHRILNVTYKTAWFMAHRIREAMKEGAWPGPLGGSGQIVEVDETFIGRKEGRKKRQGTAHKHAVASLVERGGRVRSFHVPRVNAKTLRKVLVEQVDRDSTLMTDQAVYYKTTGKEFAGHQTVNHDKEEYVRGIAHTNTIEGFFSIFKRGMVGVYQHCGEQHLQRYLTEFDFRYSNRAALGVDDKARTNLALKGIEGRRLTYRRTSGPSPA